jgi:hypothetical protein
MREESQVALVRGVERGRLSADEEIGAMGVCLSAFLDEAEVREVLGAPRPLIVGYRESVRTVIAKVGRDPEQSDIVAVVDEPLLDELDQELESAPDSEVGLGDRDAELHGAIGGRRATIA